MKKSARTKAIDIRGGAALQMRAGEPRVRSAVKAVGKLLYRFLSPVPSRPFFAVQVLIAERTPNWPKEASFLGSLEPKICFAYNTCATIASTCRAQFPCGYDARCAISICLSSGNPPAHSKLAAPNDRPSNPAPRRQGSSFPTAPISCNPSAH